jgi:uncharacterized 2Fe-2S/4Fe-4S cluster protein (DUF4445 family)
MKHKINVLQGRDDRLIEANHGENLLNVLHQHNFEINTYCGGQGVCGKCRVKIVKGAKKATSEEKRFLFEEEIQRGIRLACANKIEGDMEIVLAEDEGIEIVTSSIITGSDINLDLSKSKIILEKPTLDDQRDFVKRINDYLSTSTQGLELESLKKLEQINKREIFTITNRENKIIQIEEGDTTGCFYGIAIDIGTTTVAIYLLDLNSGKEVDVYSFYNPQKKFGADVISRINYILNSDRNNNNGKEEMRIILLKALNRGIGELIKANKIGEKDLLKITIVGNTIMLHLLLGVDAGSIAKSPYIPLFTNYLELKPDQVGLIMNKRGLIELLPSISGYVGADIIADMLAVKFSSYREGYNLLIDIGTNGEVVLGNGQNIYACSAAAGPAFEGANITFGMAGIAGAISNFRFNDSGGAVYKTIKNKRSRGICGSGLLDIIAELYRTEFIESSGAFKAKKEILPWQQKLMSSYKDQRALKVTSRGGLEIYLTQKDIREVQLAKGAIAAGIEVLKKEAGINDGQIERVFIAGGFGNYLDPHNACVIGMIPRGLEEKIVQIGNGAGTGARLYLLDTRRKQEALELRDKVEYIELSVNQDFQREYIDSMNF